jgi:hypothetical protein
LGKETALTQTLILDPLNRVLPKSGKPAVPANVVERDGYEQLHDSFVRLSKVPTSDGPRLVLYASDSIALIVTVKYANGERGIVLVRQPRAAVITDQDPDGFFEELIACRIDKDGYTLADYIVDEASKEAGVNIDRSKIRILNHGQSVALSIGVLTERQYYVAIEVSSDDILEVGDDHWFGDTTEGERIKRSIVPVEEFLRRPVGDVKQLVAQLYLRQMIVAEELTNW